VTLTSYVFTFTAFLTEGYAGQIPFASAICDWIDDCHQLYARDSKEVYRVSEIKTLTKSTRVINSLCVRAEVQKLMSLPDKGTFASSHSSLTCAH
jgi:hypothetical protein